MLSDLWEGGEADKLMQYALNQHSDKANRKAALKRGTLCGNRERRFITVG